MEGMTQFEMLAAERDYPALIELPERAREIMVLRVIGLTQDRIAARLGVSQSAISQAVSKYDPNGIYKPSMDLRKEVIKSALGSVALEATRTLVSKTEDFKSYKAATLIKIIGQIEGIQESLKGKKEIPENTTDSLKALAQ